MAVTLECATADTAPVLSNLLELYSHDMSQIFRLELRPDGSFGYDKLPLYWSEPDTHFAFLIHSDARLAGFALVTRGSMAACRDHGEVRLEGKDYIVLDGDIINFRHAT